MYIVHSLKPISQVSGTVKQIFLLFLLAGLLLYFTPLTQAVEPGEHGEHSEQSEHGESEEGGHEGNFIIDHLTETNAIELPIPTKQGWFKIPLDALSVPKERWLFGFIDYSITKQVIWMWFAGLFLIVMFMLSFRGGKLMRNKFAHLLETYILFIRNDVVYTNMDRKTGDKLMPYFLTVFFFILACNLFGMIPSGHTPTGNVNVTAGLAIVAFCVIQGMGIAQNGFFKHFRAMIPSGIPKFVIPIMIPVEIIGMLTKPFALCIRLFANMVAGHAVILAFFGLIFMAKSYFIAPLPLAGVIFISILEVFIAHLQAFIFTILVVLFTSMTVHPEH